MQNCEFGWGETPSPPAPSPPGAPPKVPFPEENPDPPRSPISFSSLPTQQTAQMTGQETNKTIHNCTALITEGVWVSWRTLGCEESRSKSPSGIQIKASIKTRSCFENTASNARRGGERLQPARPAQPAPGRAPCHKAVRTQGQRLRPRGYQHLQEPPGAPRAQRRAISATLQPQPSPERWK